MTIDAGRIKLQHLERGSELNQANFDLTFDLFKKIGDSQQFYFKEIIIDFNDTVTLTHNLSTLKIEVFGEYFDIFQWKWEKLVFPNDDISWLQLDSDTITVTNHTISEKTVKIYVQALTNIDLFDIERKTKKIPFHAHSYGSVGTSGLDPRCIARNNSWHVVLCLQTTFCCWRSQNGYDWEFISLNTGNFNSWNDIANMPSSSRFLAVGNGSSAGRLMYTTDAGLNWTVAQIPTGDAQVWSAICWSPKLFYFVGASESGNFFRTTYANQFGSDIFYTAYGNNKKIKSICWSISLEKFVAVCDNANENEGYVLNSIDGINWTSHYALPPAQANAWQSVTFSEELGLFVAVASGGQGVGRFMTSTDGVAWTKAGQAGIDSNSNFWRSVTWDSVTQCFFACNTGLEFGKRDYNYKVVFSIDGFNWQKVYFPENTAGIIRGNKICSKIGGGFVSVGASGDNSAGDFTPYKIHASDYVTALEMIKE